MNDEKKLELLKKLKSLVILQKDFLDQGNWEEYDMVENTIKKLEEEIVLK